MKLGKLMVAGLVAGGMATAGCSRNRQEAVLKAVSRPLDLVPGLAGVTILGNGRPVFVLDVARLVAT